MAYYMRRKKRRFYAKTRGNAMFRYLYQAEFADGTLITQPNLNQNHLDVSELDPTKSLFHDVISKEGLVKFRLEPQFVGTVYELDMKTGKVNGLGIFQDRVIDTPLRLVYFRRTVRTLGCDGQEGVTYKFVFGWQTTTKEGE